MEIPVNRDKNSTGILIFPRQKETTFFIKGCNLPQTLPGTYLGLVPAAVASPLCDIHFGRKRGSARKIPLQDYGSYHRRRGGSREDRHLSPPLVSGDFSHSPGIERFDDESGIMCSGSYCSLIAL